MDYRAPYCMAISKGNEYYETIEGIEGGKLGELMVVFFDTDWESIAREVEQLKNEIGDELELSVHFAKWYLRFEEAMERKHPMLEVFVKVAISHELDLEIDGTGETWKEPLAEYINDLRKGTPQGALAFISRRQILQRIAKCLMELEQIKRDFEPMIEKVLDVRKEQDGLSVVQRYRLYRGCSEHYSILEYKYSELQEELKLVVNGQAVNSISKLDLSKENSLINQVQTEKIELQYYKKSKSLGNILLYEFNNMVSKDVSMRRCAYCRRYFLPRSVTSLYCDRIIALEHGESTCQAIGAQAQYQQSLIHDEAKSVLARVKNRHRNHLQRNGKGNTTLKGTYKEWKNLANLLYGKVKRNQISYEAFSDIIDLSSNKALTKEKIEILKNAVAKE